MLIDLCTVTLPHRSGLVKDNPIMGFVFAAEADLDVAAMTNIETDLTAFFNHADATTTLSVATFIAPCISRTVAPTFRHYNLDGHLNGSAHGSPVRTQPMALLAAGSAGAVPLPSEVAVCLSYNADYGADAEFLPLSRPRARDRGRVFVGPLNDAAITEDTADHRAKIQPTFMDTLGAAGARLMARVSGGDGSWSVWSRKNAAVKNIVNVSVDNAFDTQRRRGEKASLRNNYTVG